MIERLKAENVENKIFCEKLLIQINEMTAIVRYLLPANIANIRRKIIDLLMFALLKQNKDYFVLDEKYCPTSNFIDKLKKKLEEISEKDNISEKEKSKIKEKIEFINSIKKENSPIKFPYKCTEKNIDQIMKYLSYFKKDCSKIVHISQEALKYYLLLFNDEMSKNLKNLLNVLSDVSKIGENKDISIPNKNEKEIENEEDESFNSNPKKININTALDVLLKDIYGCEATISEAKIKLKEIELKNNERLTKCSDSLCKGFEEIFNNCEKYSGIVNDNIIFNEKEN